MDSFDIIVIILSVLLGIFLILAISVCILVIGLVKKISAATETARVAVANIERVTHNVKSVANGSFATVIAGKIWDAISAKKRGK